MSEEHSCSFCHKKESELTYEIAGKNLICGCALKGQEVFICFDCVEICADIIRELRVEEQKQQKS